MSPHLIHFAMRIKVICCFLFRDKTGRVPIFSLLSSKNFDSKKDLIIFAMFEFFLEGSSSKSSKIDP